MPISEVYNMDCMEYMKGIPDKFFDLAIVDPQYGIDIMHKGGMPKHLGFKQYKRKDWDKKPPGKRYFQELFRVSKNQIIFGGNYFTQHLPPSILMDFEESFARVNYWKSKSRRFLPHCQPFRDLNNPHQIIPQWQKDMAHWADRKEIYMSCDFKDFSPRKGFLCKEYFKIL